ncbi:MAG TPA: aminopeptidase P family protein [Chitinophagales bacterium]|nr:aminopeptidase P family protein [Chitinophagales bacterium]
MPATRNIPIPQEMFVENRRRFTALLQPNSLAVFHSSDEMPRSGDQTLTFRQNPDLFYLTGIDQEESFLLIYPDSPRTEYREVLFLKRTNDHIAVWEGHKYTQDEARKISGINTVLWNDEFDTVLNLLMVYADTAYINLNENDRASWKVPYRDLRFVNELKERFPLHKFERAGRLMMQLREIKSKFEIEVIRQACGITEKAFRRVLKFMKPGVMEFEIEAEITHEFIRNRAGHAYYPIIASGKNACVLHYVDNDKPCKDGDLVLMDFGSEYANYASDLTRTIPANGKFTPRQRDMYNAVLRVMKQAQKMLRPGVILNDYNNEVGKLMEEELIGLGLLNKDEVKKQNPEKPLYKKYFMHGTSHFMGLDVHDIGNRYAPMQAGMVFTCEPGIYVPEENIGIRIENDMLVTDNVPVDLMSTIPIEVEEIEELMNASRLQPA